MTMCAPNFYAQDLTLTYVSAEKYHEEQRERLNVQDKLAVADETILALEELLARVTARLKQVESENTKLRTENCILKLGNANKRDTITQPWRVGDHTPTRYPEWYLRQYTGDNVQLLSGSVECAINGVSPEQLANGVVWFP